jgi:RNA polymerase sigma factor (sigma-70 family)
VFREEAGRLTASLVRLLGDFDLAEEMVAEAVVEALVRWPVDGVPDRPGAWLMTTARNRAIDRIRREARYRDKLEMLASLPDSASREPDDRLRLIFTCCHPALDADAQVALTLRAVAGLTTAEIARAFVVPESVRGRMQRLRVEHRRADSIGPHPDRLPIPLIFGRGLCDPHGSALGNAQSSLVELASEDAMVTGIERLRYLVALTSISRVIWLRSVCHRTAGEQPDWNRAKSRRLACYKILRGLHPLTHVDGAAQDDGVVLLDRPDILHWHYENLQPALRKL